MTRKLPPNCNLTKKCIRISHLSHQKDRVTIYRYIIKEIKVWESRLKESLQMRHVKNSTKQYVIIKNNSKKICWDSHICPWFNSYCSAITQQAHHTTLPKCLSTFQLPQNCTWVDNLNIYFYILEKIAYHITSKKTAQN